MRASALLAVTLALTPVCTAVAAETGGTSLVDESDRDEGNEEGTGRSFLYKEVVLSGFYSPKGIEGIPIGDQGRDHLDFSFRPPGNYVGADYVQTFTPRFFMNRTVLPDWLPLTAVDLHPRITYEPMVRKGGMHRVKFAPQDFWLRFNPGSVDRLTLRFGEFVIPYGVNPILAPRQRFLLPLEATDLGLKWDWGADLKGPLGEYDWEAAATVGWGEGVHSPDWGTADRRSYLLMGRIGAPTYWDLQYGASFLYGDLPTVRGAVVVDPNSISRWRVSADGFYKYGTYLMTGTQLTFGEDGFAGDERFVGITGGKTANVLGALGWADWVVPMVQDLRLAVQFESVIRDLSTAHSDDTAAIFEIGYSILTSVSLMWDYRVEFNRSMGEDANAFFLTFIYYGS